MHPDRVYGEVPKWTLLFCPDFKNEVGIFIFLDKHGMGVMSDLRF